MVIIGIKRARLDAGHIAFCHRDADRDASRQIYTHKRSTLRFINYYCINTYLHAREDMR